MGELKSNVPALLAERGWDKKTFTGKCLLAGLSTDTAARLLRGETNFSVETLRVVANIFELNSISEVIDFADGQK